MEEKEAKKQYNSVWSISRFWNVYNTSVRPVHNRLFSSRTSPLKGQTGIQVGFTLIEIIIVVAIVAMLVTVFLLFGSPSRQTGKAKDAERISDVKQLKIALDLYYDDHKCYPDSIPDDTWIENGVVYILRVPKDPDTGLAYSYQVDSSDSCPQWNVIYTTYTSRQYTEDDCALSKMTTCNYTSEMACSISGQVDCSFIANSDEATPSPQVPNTCTAQENINREYGKSGDGGTCNHVPIGTGQYCDDQCTMIAE